jgi:hypothetical protein
LGLVSGPPWLIRPAMVHDVSAEDAEDEDSEREDIHAASWGNGPKAPGRTRTCNHGVPTMRFTKPAYANSATGALRVGSGGQDLHLLAALSLDSSGFYNPPYQAPCLRRIPARTLQACPVNSGRGATLVCSLSSCSACADLASQRVLPRRRPRDGWAAAVSGVWLSQPRIPLAELPASRSSRPGGSYWPDVAGGQNQEYKRAGQALRHPVPLRGDGTWLSTSACTIIIPQQPESRGVIPPASDVSLVVRGHLPSLLSPVWVSGPRVLGCRVLRGPRQA